MSTDPPVPAGMATGHQGVIHDIGYRHFAGERRGTGYIRRSLFIDSLRGAFGLGRSARSKVMPMLLFGVMCLPAGVIVAITAVAEADALFGDYPSYLINLQIIISIFVAAQSPVLVSRDLRFGVMPLYFSRPLDPLDYVLGKYGAMTSALFVLTAVPLTILFIGALLVGLPLREQVPDYLRSLGGAAVLSLVLAGIGLLIAAITPRRGLAVAAVIAVLLILAGVQGITQGIASEEGVGASAAYFSLISPHTLVEGIQSSLFGAEHALPPPGATGTTIFSVAALALIVACFGGLLLRYRSVSVS